MARTRATSALIAAMLLMAAATSALSQSAQPQEVQTTAMPVIAPPLPPPEIEYDDPPEEDESYAAPEYFFNPLQSKKELDAGNFYFKKGNYAAAKNRYLEATLWDDFSPEPFLRLGEAFEKLDDYPAARQAWNKFLELTEDEGKARDVRQIMAKWPPDESPDALTPEARERQTREAAERLLKAIEQRRR